MKKAFILLLVIVFMLTGCGGNPHYEEDLKDTAGTILDSAAAVEEIANEYANIWSFSIQSGTAIEVKDMSEATGLGEDDIREHFQLNAAGNVPGDFSTNVGSLRSYFEGTGKLDEVKKSSDEIKEKMSKLKDPPSKFEKAYDEMLDMYAYYKEYASMVIGPDGSLQSFNENREKLSNEIASCYNKIKALTE